MAIEFQCSGCGQNLRVPDDAAGKQAKCPQCSTIMLTPSASSSSFPPPIRPAASSVDQYFDSANPYASPTADSAVSIGVGDVIEGPLNALQALSIAWQLFKVHAGLLIGVILIQYLVQFVFSGISWVANFTTVGQNGQVPPESHILNAVISIFSSLASSYLAIGSARINLAVAQRQPVSIEMLFSGGRYFLRVLGAWILLVIIVGLGLIAFIVPGIYLLLTYWPVHYFIIDRDCSIGQAFRLSRECMPGNRSHAFGLWLWSILLGIGGAMLCGVGLIVTIPLMYLMYTVGYLMVSNQRQVMQ